MKLGIFKYSERGPRLENQDAIGTVVMDDVFGACIADGVGGSSCGSVASSESVSEFISCMSERFLNLKSIIDRINDRLGMLQLESNECKGMATTFTGYFIVENILSAVHIGDSRLSILRNNGIKQLSHDQTELSMLLRTGQLSIEEAKTYPRRHVLLSALTGSRNRSMEQYMDFEILQGDRILLTTDGVHDLLTKVELRDLSINSLTVEEFGTKILKMLKSKSLTDNYSFIIVEVL
jgi:protein phosphatase